MSVPVIYFDLGDTLVFGPAGNRQLFDDALATIEELWLRGYRIGLLSDQPVGTTEQDVRAKLEEYGLEPYRFDVVTISSEFDPPVYKPDPLIFETAATKAGHASASSDTVFVTETLAHVEAARDLGWRAIHKPYQASCTPASGECVADLDELLTLFPQLPVDLYIRDAPSDPGDDLYTGSNFWNSPDLWVRHQQDGGTAHQSPAAGQDNWFYTRVRNRGSGIARTFYVGHSVKEWAGTQFVYPDDYLPFIPPSLGDRMGFNLEPGDAQVLYSKWAAADVPPAGIHVCWLAAAQVLAGGADGPAAGAHVWEHNNLAQKNLTIVELAAGDAQELSVVLGSRRIRQARYYTLELYRSRNARDLPVSLSGQSARAMGKLVRAGREFVRQPAAAAAREEIGFRFLESARVRLTGGEARERGVTLELAGGSTLTLETPAARKGETAAYTPKFTWASLVEEKSGHTAIAFARAAASGIGIALRPQQIVRARLRVVIPKGAKPGEQFELDLVQRGEDGRIEGGVTLRINVQARQTKNPPRPTKKTSIAGNKKKKT